MTKSEIITRAAGMLEDEGLVHFVTRDFTDSFHDGYELVSVLTGCIERCGTFATVAYKAFYNMHSSIADLFAVFAFYDRNNDRWLDPESLQTFKNYSQTFLTAQANPREWAPIGLNYVCFYPAPPSIGSYYCFYKAVAQEIADGDTPEIFDDLQDVLVEYIVADLLDQNLEYTKSQVHFETFISKCIAIQARMDKRDWPERIMALRG